MTRRARTAVILAAGHGRRMKSRLAKPLHVVGGCSMLEWSLVLADAVGVDRKVVVWGAHAPAVRDVAQAAGALTVLQDPPKGTGHAVQQAQGALTDFEGDVIVLYADTPLVRPETVEQVFATLEAGAAVSVLGFEPETVGEYGRLIENADGGLDAIVEVGDATSDQLAVRLCNSGIMAAPAAVMFELLGEVTNANASGEYYLTDIVGLARARDLPARAVRADADEVMGVNSCADLAAAEAVFQMRCRHQALADGVRLTAPDTVMFSHDTIIGEDVLVEPNVIFGPGVVIRSGARIRAFSHLEGAEIDGGCEVGPYARLRPGTRLRTGAKVGNFVEVKKAKLGEGAKVNHLSYIGDAQVGARANIGAGAITCNYDGFRKHATVIGDGAFIGSNTSLVAPVTVGENAMIGSGGVITEDVPADALAVSRARQTCKQGWASRFRRAMSLRKDKAGKESP